MVKNTRGGKKCKKGKKTVNYDLEKIDETKGYYATISQRLGGRPARFLVKHNDNDLTSEVQIRNKLHKRLWINSGDIVFVNDGGEIVKVFKIQQDQDDGNNSDASDNSYDSEENLTNKLKCSDENSESKSKSESDNEDKIEKNSDIEESDDGDNQNILVKQQPVSNTIVTQVVNSINIDDI